MPISTIYNPQEMREDLFRKSFVVRRALLEDLLRAIRNSAPGERFQHTILQGQRGQGKTTLLRKLSLCVRDDPDLSPWLIPILFREEEYSVVSLCRLWERTADYLAEHPGFETLPEQFEAALVSPHYEKDCFDILARALEQQDKHLLLLIDNFGELLDKFGRTDQQRFREILLTSRLIRIVAGSAATLEQHYDHGKPFFNFFRLCTLEGLNAQETRELMLSLGDEEQRKRMAEILETRPGKLEALRRLTAGVPRTLILLFEIFLDDDGSAMEDLEVLLDRVTPLYKHRLDDLPTQQQAIVYQIAMGWDALSVKEIAAKTRLPSKQVSAQLQLLEKNRIVRSITTSTKNKLYQLEERFFNIWCLMRLGRSGDKRRAVWLVRFLEIWCDQEELAERVKRHIEVLQAGRMAPEHALFLTQAYAEVLQDMDLQDELLSVAKTTLEKYLSKTSLPDSDKALVQKGISSLEQNDFLSAISYFEPILERGYIELATVIAFAYNKLGSIDQAKRYYRLAIREFGDLQAVYNMAILCLNQNDLKKAEYYFRKAAKKDHPESLVFLSLALLRHGKPKEEALILSKRALKYFNDSFTKLALSFVLLWCDDFYSAFVNIEDALIKLDKDEDKKTLRLLQYCIYLLVAKNQTAFALKLFENEKYAALNLKERLKPIYYAVLHEVGPSRADDTLRMGSELQDTVDEIRQKIERIRQDYRVTEADVVVPFVSAEMPSTQKSELARSE